MELLNKIQKVEAPGYLKTRIEGALQDVKILIPQKLIFIYASVFILFLSFQLIDFKADASSNEMDTYASYLGINPTETYSYE